MISGLMLDARIAARNLRRHPSFGVTVLLTLALGLGATTAMFSVVNGVLLRPLPYHEPGQLVSIYTSFPYWKGKPLVGDFWNRLRTPYPEYTAAVAGQRTFEQIAGFQVSLAPLTIGQQTISTGLGSATANLLPLLGVRPAFGRWFLPGEDGPGATRLTLLSHGLWRQRFGGDSSVLGRTVVIDEQPFTVIGVLPAGFTLTANEIESNGTRTPDLWVPVGADPQMLQPGNHTLELIGRLRAGVTPQRALADIEPLLRGTRAPGRRGAALERRADIETAEVRRPIVLLLAAVGLLFVITCINVAMLFLGECATRQRELNTRHMLGATRYRLIRLLFVESTTIAILGALAGSLVAWWGTRLMLGLAPIEIPHTDRVGVDLRVTLFTFGVALLIAVASGVLPALTLTRTDVMRHASNRVASGRSRWQSVAIALQACLSIVLMAGAGLMVRSLMNEQRVNPGFRVANMLTLRVQIPESADRSTADRLRLYAIARDAIERVPGVVRVTAVLTPPLSGRTDGQSITPLTGENEDLSSKGEVERQVVLPNYFDVLGISILKGRAFTGGDVAGSPLVAVVSEGFARRFWPGQSALGQQFKAQAGVATIVGIARDLKNKSVARAPEGVFYLSQLQEPASLSFIAETRGNPDMHAAAAERAVWSSLPGATVSEVSSLAALLDRSLAPTRYRALLAGLFAVLALLLTAVGLAGLTARAVAARMRELSIRMAIGATPLRALVAALGGALAAVSMGLAAGLVAAPLSTRFFSVYLFEVSGRDLPTHAATAVIALSVCMVTTYLATARLRSANLVAVLKDE